MTIIITQIVYTSRILMKVVDDRIANLNKKIMLIYTSALSKWVELQEALRLSGTTMAELWVKPYV